MFVVKIMKLVKRKCVALLLSHCCYIHEVRVMSAVLHSVVVAMPCVSCLAAEEDIICDEKSGERPMRDTKMTKNVFPVIPSNSTGSFEN